MTYYGIRFHIFLCFLTCLSFYSASAQEELELDGDSIFVNELGDISIKFPDKVVDRAINPTEAKDDYYIRSAFAEKGYRIGTKEADIKTSVLTIIEGGRTHRILLVYYKDVDFISGKFNRDYSTKEKLAQRVIQIKEARKKKPTSTPATDIPTSVAPPPGSDPPPPPPADRNQKYIEAMGAGMAFEENRNYSRAKQEFERALQFKPGDLSATNKIKQLNKILIDNEGKIDNDKKASLYKAYMDSAKTAESKSQYSLANMFYQKALTTKQNDPVATARLKDNDKKEKLENDYADAMDKAQRFFNERELEKSKDEYEKALKIFNRLEPKNEIAKINQLLKRQKDDENRERDEMEREKSVTKRYIAQIQKADAEFDKNNYTLAKKFYNEASITKPDENHPKDRIAIIDNFFETKRLQEKERKDSIDTARKIAADFNSAKARGNAYEKQGDLERALIEYSKASGFFPEDANVAEKVQKINIEIIKIAEVKKIDSLYQRYKEVGDSLISSANESNYLDNYSKAEVSFKAAHDLMPAEIYATEQIKYMRNDVDDRRKDREYKVKNDSIELAKKNYRDFNTFYNKGASSFQDKKYTEAKNYFEEARKIYPDNESVNQYLNIIENQFVKKQTAALISNEKFTRQNNPIPYTDKELAEKDSETDFSKPPKNQLFADKITNKKNVKAFITDILTKEPIPCNYKRDFHITLACQGTFIQDGYLYLKFILQNGSGGDFDTGKMELTPLSSPAQIIKPVMLYPDKFPIVKSHNEVQLVYVCGLEYVPQNEKLVFEVFDRQMSMSIKTTLDPIKK